MRVFISMMVLFVGLLCGCGTQSPYSPEVTEALEAAGDNRVELEQVLEHYAVEGDSLKQQAASWLIANMGEHCYATYTLDDSTGAEVDFNILDYPDYETMKAACNALEESHGELEFERGEKILDLDTITADFLIDQIDYAFLSWRDKPWAKALSFDQFRRYVLPYRGSNEPLEPWRETFREMYKDIAGKMTDSTDAIEAASLINSDIRSWFSFDPRYYYHPTDQGLSEMLENRMGRCEDMTNLAIYAMRANGLAVTSDYTPYWANTGNNHAWNAIVTPDGEVIPFMGAESNPGDYKLANKMAKTYRKAFDKQKDNLAFQDNQQEKTPRWLAGKSYIDVTADYIDVCDVSVKFTKDIPDSVDMAYLCVFNSGEWKAIHWGRIEGDSVIFTDMGRDIAYLPALYMNEEVAPWGAPFLLDSNCNVGKFRPEDDSVITTSLVSTTHRKQKASTDGIAETFLTVGQEYELFYFDDGWESLGMSVAGDEPLVFTDVPAGCLYWLVATDSDNEERIFTIEDGKQIWW